MNGNGYKMDTPNCYKCIHRRELEDSAHSRCLQRDAEIEGHERGIACGWFVWPYNFDPVWLLKCNAFEENKKI